MSTWLLGSVSSVTWDTFERGNFVLFRVPAVYLTLANSLLLAFLTFNEINKLRVISEAQNSDSPRLHQFPALNLPVNAVRLPPNLLKQNP